MNEPQAHVVASNDLLASASAHIEICHKRGQICRGAYIVDASGLMHLSKDGVWTKGIAGPQNWWETLWHAEQALKQFKANPTGQRTGAIDEP